MASLLRNSRFYVLLTSFFLSLIFAGYSYFLIPAGILQNIRFEQLCGFASLIYLYVSMLIGPFFYQFSSIKGRALFTHMRRSIGVSACYFALLHTFVTFFVQLQGFSGLAFLSSSYVFALMLGGISLCILLILTLTSVDIAVEKMGFSHWKLLHRLTYLGGIIVLMHVILLGSHYSELGGVISQITFVAVSFLFILNAIRFDHFLKKKYAVSLRLGITTTLTTVVLLVFFFTIITPFYTVQNGTVSFGIHSAHIKLAEEAQSQTPSSQATTIPGLDGDRSLRYTVSLSKPDQLMPNQDTTLTFSVFNASTGNPVGAYKPVYTKLAHLIIVDDTLQDFSHLHPQQEGNEFVITTQFPRNGTYHMYLDFQPYGGIEQQIGFSVSVGDSELTQKPQKTDTVLSKTFGSYTVSVNTHGTLRATTLSVGQQTISFTINDAKTKKPITTLKPYLGAMGHLVMIREEDYSYMHVHPTNLTTLPDTAVGGPTVDFLPIGIYGAFKPGTYRAFAEFNPDGTLITTDFTLTIQ